MKRKLTDRPPQRSPITSPADLIAALLDARELSQVSGGNLCRGCMNDTIHIAADAAKN